VKLPKFEMMMSKCEANNKPVLAASDVHIVTVYAFLPLYICFALDRLISHIVPIIYFVCDRYGRIYCLQLDRVNMALNLYRFYRDAVVQQV
jgi:hypothetical protein